MHFDFFFSSISCLIIYLACFKKTSKPSIHRYNNCGERSEHPEADGNFSIYLYIYLFIYLVSRASWIPGSFEKAWLLCCNAEGVAQCCMHVQHALSTITGYLLRTVARYAEVHSALQPAGEAARL